MSSSMELKISAILSSRFHTFILLFIISFQNIIITADQEFGQNYYVTWGPDHFSSSNDGKEIQIYLDFVHGAGIQSNLKYGSGFFGMKIKVHKGDSAGVLTSFYLHSHTTDTTGKDIHDEIDFEFLGNQKGGKYFLQTNLYVDGRFDGREQKVVLWFDPSDDFHSYRILWNAHQIVFFVDDIPIRVYKNNTRIGGPYPTQPMKIEASIYDADNWVTDGGQTKTNWSNAPFYAHYRDFNIDGCPQNQGGWNPNVGKTLDCLSDDQYWWNTDKFWNLTWDQQQAYENVKMKYLHYDYCVDSHRYPVPLPECLE